MSSGLGVIDEQDTVQLHIILSQDAAFERSSTAEGLRQMGDLRSSGLSLGLRSSVGVCSARLRRARYHTNSLDVVSKFPEPARDRAPHPVKPSEIFGTKPVSAHSFGVPEM